MGDASKHAGAKPRLSLFSSKQAVIRLKSDDQIDQQTPIIPTQTPETQTDRNEVVGGVEIVQNPDFDKEARVTSNTQNAVDKMNISKEDLIRLLSMLKSELQSKEIALAAIKCEQLKRLINPIEISRSALASTYIKLQDRVKQKDQNNNTKEKTASQNASVPEQKQAADRRQEGNCSSDDIDEENLNILIALLELLDQHPLLALPRDSIYCLDYNCNELSTKNYLNLKIQHLDNLIEQHRRFRYYMTNRLQRSEQRLSEVTAKLELERSLKLENAKTIYGPTRETALLKRIEELGEALEKEKRDKQVIVMTLLNELLDEREKFESLAKQLAKSRSLRSDEISGEKDKLLMMQTKMDGLNLQLKKQSNAFAKEREELLSKLSALKTENESLKCKLDPPERRPVSSSKPSQQENKEMNRTGSPSSPGRTGGSKSSNSSNNRNQAILNSPTATMRASKPSPPSKISMSPNSTHTAQSTVVQQQASSSTRQTPNSNIRSAGSPSSARPMGGSSGGEHSAVRAQPLFKSASVMSTNQQVRGQRTSNNNQLVRAASSAQTPVSKPQVPAKPAQLLDQQRSSLN